MLPQPRTLSTANTHLQSEINNAPLLQLIQHQEERIQNLEIEVKRHGVSLKKICRDYYKPTCTFGDPKRITDTLRKYAHWFPEEVEYRESATKEFLDFALIKDPNGRVAADEFLSYLIHYYIEEDILFEPYMLPELMEKNGYSNRKYHGKTYFEGLSWNPEFKKEQLQERPEFNIADYLKDKSERLPVYKYPWIGDDSERFLNIMKGTTDVSQRLPSLTTNHCTNDKCYL